MNQFCITLPKKTNIPYFRYLQKNSMSKQNLMKTAQLLFLLTAALFVSTFANAQSKALIKADDEFATEAYIEAAKLYKTAEPTAKELDEKGRIFFQIGECYRLSKLYSQSEEWYAKAITAQYNNINAEVHYNYGMALQEQGKFDDATAQYNKYLNKGGEKSKANAAIAACKDASDKKSGKTKIMVENLAEVNSPSYDFSLVYSAKKGDEFIFSSSRKESTGTAVDPVTGEDFFDLYVVERDKKKKWGTPAPLKLPVNTNSHEAAACFNKDFSVMYYTECKYDGDMRYGCDILSAKKSGSGYGDPVNLNLVQRGEGGDDSSRVGHPALSPDDKYMVFSSNMPGGKGGRDLWYVTYDKKSDSWSKPTNLSNLNTAGDEMFPFIAKDGNIYFSSNGRGGMGGLDIYKAEKTGDMTFNAPTAMEYPINSSSDDFGFVLNEPNDETKFSGYFTSNRPGGKGLDDIYSFTEPPVEFELIGIVYDEKTGAVLANSNVTVRGSNGDDYKVTTDGNGGFSLDKSKIKGGTTYVVDVQKDQYIGTGDKFSTVGISSSTKFAREYFLKPIIKDVEYKMPLVLYPYDKAELLVDENVNSQDSLNYLLDLMQRNPTFVIQLEAHTDARGNDKYNQDLSQRRAQTCVDYLISKGIDPARLKAVGKGEMEPRTLATAEGTFAAGTKLTEAYINKLPADQQEAAHLLNRRTIFRIIDTNFVPKK